MKKILLCILLIGLVSGASAQSSGIVYGSTVTTVTEKVNPFGKDDIFSIRAGVNISTTATSDNYFGGGEHSKKAGVGFSIQGVYERKLARYTPLYFQTGIGVTSRKSSFESAYISEDGLDGSRTRETITETFSLWYLQLPLMLNYKFAIGEKFAISPFVGVNLEYGIGGNIKTNWKATGSQQGTSESKDKAFDKNGFRRFSVAPTLGVGFEWKKIYLGFAAQFGVTNLLSKEYLDDYARDEGGKKPKIAQNSFTFSVGYKF